MAKSKGKAKPKKLFEHVMTADEVRPGPIAYIKAVFLLVVNWFRQHRFIGTALAIVLLAAGSLAVVLITRRQVTLTNDQIVIKINKTLHIEGDANPAILAVTDETKANQPFLDIAKNGDKVLLYYKARQAILFRPTGNEIIRKGSFTPPNAKIFIRDGTAQDSRINEIKSKLESIKEIDLVSTDSSVKQDYKGTTLVSVTDRYDSKVAELETLFDTKVQRIPDGETFPDADILIIVGD